MSRDEQPIRVGQVWESKDRREQGRRVRIESVSPNGRLVVRGRTGGRSTRHTARAFAKGWRLVEDAPNARPVVLPCGHPIGCVSTASDLGGPGTSYCVACEAAGRARREERDRLQTALKDLPALISRALSASIFEEELTPDVRTARLQIAALYSALKADHDFTTAAHLARVEWLAHLFGQYGGEP